MFPEAIQLHGVIPESDTCVAYPIVKSVTKIVLGPSPSPPNLKLICGRGVVVFTSDNSWFGLRWKS